MDSKYSKTALTSRGWLAQVDNGDRTIVYVCARTLIQRRYVHMYISAKCSYLRWQHKFSKETRKTEESSGCVAMAVSLMLSGYVTTLLTRLLGDCGVAGEASTGSPARLVVRPSVSAVSRADNWRRRRGRHWAWRGHGLQHQTGHRRPPAFQVPAG